MPDRPTDPEARDVPAERAADHPEAEAEAAASAVRLGRAQGAGPMPVLPAGAAFEGLLVLPGPARIDGRVRGEVLAASDVWIGRSGQVEADLEVRAVTIEGTVEGDVIARERIDLRGTARVHGRVSAPRLSMAEGSVVDGDCRAGETAPQA
jgi:cytoskeletal protein CcmA (bactofilin family)